MNAFSIGVIVPGISTWAEIANGIKLLEKRNQKDSLGYFINEKGIPQSITNKESLVAQLFSSSQFPVICNGNEEYLSVLTATSFPHDQQDMKVSILDLKLNDKLWMDIDFFSVVKDVGAAWNAISLNVDPPGNTNLVLNQILFNNIEREIQYGLPPLPEKKTYGIKIYELPTHFAWINYWSKQLVANAQIDTDLAKKLFYKVELLENDAVIIQLTKAPLDLEIPEHLDLLKKAYKTFKRVGGRHLLPGHLRRF